MKALIGTAAVAVLVFAACETPAPQRVMGPPAPTANRYAVVPDRSTDPMIIIDGVVQKGSGADLRTTRDAAITGKAADIVVRGTPSVASGAKGILSRLPADSIASIEVLKGNAATAKYGARAVNGVIIITMKGAVRDTLHM